MTIETWMELGFPAPGALVAARLTLHMAAQAPAAFALAHVPAEADWSHYALHWDGGSGALVSRANGDGVRAGLLLTELALVVQDSVGLELERLPLAGRSLAEALIALADAVARATGAMPVPLALPEHELPDHPLAHGARFAAPDDPQREALSELSRWYAASHAVLTLLAEAQVDASAAVVWPHHFDIATLITVAPASAEACTIGVGMTPGDGSYAEPYLYVTPWPYPDQPELAPLAGGGRWQTDGWFGAVLTGGDLVAAPRGARPGAVEAFLASAIDAAKRLLATTH